MASAPFASWNLPSITHLPSYPSRSLPMNSSNESNLKPRVSREATGKKDLQTCHSARKQIPIKVQAIADLSTRSSLRVAWTSNIGRLRDPDEKAHPVVNTEPAGCMHARMHAENEAAPNPGNMGLLRTRFMFPFEAEARSAQSSSDPVGNSLIPLPACRPRPTARRDVLQKRGARV